MEKSPEKEKKINWKSLANDWIKKIESIDDLDDFDSMLNLGKESFNKKETTVFSSKRMIASVFTNRNFLFSDFVSKVTSVVTKGYGACFYFSVIRFLTGEEDESLMFELKIRVVEYIIYNESIFREIVAKYNSFAPDEDGVLIKNVDDLKISILKETYWAGPLQILATATYLHRPIQIFGCHTNGQRCTVKDCLDRHHLHFLYNPIDELLVPTYQIPITLIFVPMEPISTRQKNKGMEKMKLECNHFEPLLPIDLKNKNFFETISKAPAYKIE